VIYVVDSKVDSEVNIEIDSVADSKVDSEVNIEIDSVVVCVVDFDSKDNVGAVILSTIAVVLLLSIAVDTAGLSSIGTVNSAAEDLKQYKHPDELVDLVESELD
jgi:hypothetical protein